MSPGIHLRRIDIKGHILSYHFFTLGASGSVSVFAIVRALRFLDCESRCA